jgi:hypothetical protein
MCIWLFYLEFRNENLITSQTLTQDFYLEKRLSIAPNIQVPPRIPSTTGTPTNLPSPNIATAVPGHDAVKAQPMPKIAHPTNKRG